MLSDFEYFEKILVPLTFLKFKLLSSIFVARFFFVIFIFFREVLVRKFFENSPIRDFMGL